MRRFHIALAVSDIANSIRDYSNRLGQEPTVVVMGKYAMWRTQQLNFSISELPQRAGQLRHLGFEDESARSFSVERDINGVEWELFSPDEQDKRFVRCTATLRKLREVRSADGFGLIEGKRDR